MRKFKMGIRRLGASLSALLMVCCLTVPALAAGPISEAPMPSYVDFIQHKFSWYVWRSDGSDRAELIASPLFFDSDGYLSGVSSGYAYNMSITTRQFSNSDSSSTVTYGFPNLCELYGACGSWRYYPSFPVGHVYSDNAHIKLYPYVKSGLDKSVLESNGYVGAVCPSPEYYSLTSSIGTNSSIPNGVTRNFPEFPFNQFLYPISYGPWSEGNNHGTTWSIFNNLDDDFFARPSNSYRYGASPFYCPVLDSALFWSSGSVWQNSGNRFPLTYSFPSSVAHCWIAKKSSPTGSLSGLRFIPTLSVPYQYLPSGVQFGDWISSADLEKMQDQLLNDFGVSTDTLKESKNNFDSWQNSNTIDTDVANTSLDIINGLMQNVGQFAFIVSLLCFGAVVLRVLIRKAVEG
ncbi:protein C [Inovirus sp.]|nr:protein C [Inovirus sp.]